MAVEAPPRKTSATLPEQLAAIAQECGGDGGSIQKTLREAGAQQRPLIAAILDEKLVDETQFMKGVAAWLQIPWHEEAMTAIAAPLREKFPPWLALRHHLFPHSMEEGLVLVTYDPFNLSARQAVAQAVPEKITWRISTRRQILMGLRQGYGVGADTFEQLVEGRGDEEVLAELKQETNVLDAEDSSASVVTFREPDHQGGVEGARHRHPRRAAGERPAHPLPHRRRAARDARAAEHPHFAGIVHFAPQDHGEPQHRRAPPAAGRKNQPRARRARHRRARRHHPVGHRGKHQPAFAGPAGV